MKLPTLFLTAALFLAGTLTAIAQTTVSTTDVPRTISYQGLLTSADGTPFADGTYDVTVTLYGDENGSRQVWRETYSTPVTGGIFNLHLGSGAIPLPTASAMNAPLWIGTSVNGAPEMRPLTPLAASPYALNVPDKAITAEKVDMNYVAELRIDGQPVSGKGTVLNLKSTPGVPLSYDAATQSVTIGSGFGRGESGDDEKGASVLATNMDVWTMRGDGRSFNPGFPAVVPGLGDWIGTSNAIDFIIKVNGQQTMQYQQTGAFAIPNIIGGQGNTVTAATSVASIIAGGNASSIVTGDYDVIAGGRTNSLEHSHYSAIGGGSTNTTSYGDYNATGGGLANVVYYGEYGAIGGGENNSIDNTNHGAIGGGTFNTMLYGDFNTIGGGSNNLVWNPAGYAINGVTIGGGEANRAEIDYTTIAGGSNNAIISANPGTTEYSFIGGGSLNVIDGISQHAVVAGGKSNQVVNAADYGTISGGEGNQINREYGTIAGGQDNFIDDTSPYATISGGSANNVGTGGDHSTVGGGSANNIAGPYGTISGGLNNAADVNSVAAVIGGGELNTITTNGRYSTIGGGGDNNIQDNYGTISGGRNNTIDNTSGIATIGGGRDNIISNNGDFSTVGGGEGNNTQGSHTTIPGGDLLTTNPSYAQTAVGFFNKPRGSMGVRPNAATIAASNDPVFMVGNGNVSGGSGARSNAFEVSYNGHTSVYGVNGTTAPSITGGTFVDNVIYAWADVPRTTIGGPVAPLSNFGVQSINRIAAGVYDVTIAVTDPAGNVVALPNASVTATIVEDNILSPIGCGMIVTSHIGAAGLPANTFRLWTYNLTSGSCAPADRAFMFKVTGRP